MSSTPDHPDVRHPLPPAARRAAGALITAAGTFLATGAHAGSADFATTNIQYLHGAHYADFNPNGGFSHGDEASIITLEHFDAWKYGDNFFFVDITNPDGEGDGFGTTGKASGSYYGEISPRLSIGKIFFDRELSWGLIKDVLFTSTLEVPESPVKQTWLYGAAVDLNLPGFQFFQVNWYIRDPQESGIDTGQQITLAWGAPFKIGPVPMLFEGFLDYAWGVDPLKDNIITAPRLLVDVGDLMGFGAGKLQAGVEWQMWHNKFGIAGMDESVPQAMVKWIW